MKELEGVGWREVVRCSEGGDILKLILCHIERHIKSIILIAGLHIVNNKVVGENEGSEVIGSLTSAALV